ncbi:MAG: c-type cytochrome [Candidatus Methylumidiphilus sp.]
MKKKFSVVGTILAGAFLVGIAQSALAEGEPDAAKGEKLYQREGCQGCHGADLKGSAPGAPNLLTSAKTANIADFTKAVVTEGKGPMAIFKANAKVSAGIADLFAFVSSKKPK